MFCGLNQPGLAFVVWVSKRVCLSSIWANPYQPPPQSTFNPQGRPADRRGTDYCNVWVGGGLGIEGPVGLSLIFWLMAFLSMLGSVPFYVNCLQFWSQRPGIVIIITFKNATECSWSWQCHPHGPVPCRRLPGYNSISSKALYTVH